MDEHKFCTAHTHFWQTLLPLGDKYVRSANRRLLRHGPTLTSIAPAQDRGLINELAFRVFEEAFKEDIPPDQLSSDAWSRSVSKAEGRMLQLLERRATSAPIVGDLQRREARELSTRLWHYFLKRDLREKTRVAPEFSGCGRLSNCEGDVLQDGVLYEIKSGDRDFRIQDFRQLVVYAALDFASNQKRFHGLALYNGRQSTSFVANSDQLVFEMSGRSTPEVYETIIEFLSEPISST